MAKLVLDSHTPFRFTINGDVTNGVVVADLLGGSGGASEVTTLAVTGASTLAATTATTLAASSSLTVTGASIIGLDVPLLLDIPTLVTAGSGVYRFASPFAGTIATIRANVYGGTLAGGDANVHASIAGVAVMNGVIALTNGSVAGTTFSQTPSAANVVTAGQDVSFSITGAQATFAARCTLTIVIRRSA